MLGRFPIAILCAWLAAGGGWLALASSNVAAAAEVDYSRDVQPILSDNCLECHGQDASTREADLRLDVLTGAGDVRGAEEVLVAGDAAASELLRRVTSEDEYERMPPVDSGKTLTEGQIATLRRWIASGAHYEKHWAFEAPRRPAAPAVKNAAWVRNPIDAFVLARLEREGLAPSPAADPLAMLRRLSLDLVGLPPTPEEIEAFQLNWQGDDWAEAYEQEIERLLASPHYGERWGRLWLDAARYADSDGYEKDKPREVWMYRDWVIRALNKDKPYDQFIIEQIAGDLLPGAGQAERIATGFLRNSMINEEGGIDPEQFRMEAMYDRMDAVGKGILGLTVQCAQCHTHKYDPITQTDYYRMFALVNNCHEGQITVYTKEQREEWAATETVIRQIEDRLREANPDWRERMAAWEAGVAAKGAGAEWTVVRPQLDSSGDQKHYLQDDGSILAAGYAPTKPSHEFTVDVEGGTIRAVRLELLNDPSLPHGGPGRSIYGLCALTEFQAVAEPRDGSEKATELKFKEAMADVNPPERELAPTFDDRSGRRRVTGPVAYANDGDVTTAWGLNLGPGRSNVPREAVFVLAEPLDCSGAKRITFKLVQKHGGWNSDDNQNNNLGRFRFSVTESDRAQAEVIPESVHAILSVPAGQRTADREWALFSYWRTTVAEWREENRRIDELWQSHPQGATQLVLIEREKRRPTHRLERGNFLEPAEEVEPGVPEFLHPLEREAEGADGPANRLDFARWLVDRRSPTTARSIVNRIWQAYFGRGLVGTSEDLGTQGDEPTHPELLDWLAVELMDNGWSLKHIHRLIVSSATYRQSSTVSEELVARDPANELLARGPRYRLDAEIVRDVALVASGLLTRTLGGPSVYPPAPEFLFQPPASYGPKPWHYEKGAHKYRRAIYTFRYRSVPHPALANFDMPNGEFSCTRRPRSNTPLQALTTLNEPLFMECARALAAEALRDGGTTDEEKLNYVVQRCLTREPDARELSVLGAFLEAQRARFAGDGANPVALVNGEEGKANAASAMFVVEDASPAEHAAWIALARVVLNLDETITKE